MVSKLAPGVKLLVAIKENGNLHRETEMNSQGRIERIEE